jgi:hypothetical protein
MAPMLLKKTTVNPTLVRVDVVGAARVSRTRSGKGLVRTDGFRVSSNLNVRGPKRVRLTRVAVGNDIASATPADVSNAIALKDTASKWRRAGPSACKRKEARAVQEVLSAIDPHNYHKSFWRIKLFLQYHFYATQLKLSYLSYGKILF